MGGFYLPVTPVLSTPAGGKIHTKTPAEPSVGLALLAFAHTSELYFVEGRGAFSATGARRHSRSQTMTLSTTSNRLIHWEVDSPK